ncbi:4517_t:CDS:2, partial [Acaulospora colombiana]
MVNVTDLMVLGAPNSHPHALSNEKFNEIFTPDRPIHFSYHGYPIELAGLLFGRPNLERVSMEGYREEGTTTTPLAMMVLNQVSRYDVAKVAITAARKVNDKVDPVADKLLQQIDKQVDDFWKYIKETGK